MTILQIVNHTQDGDILTWAKDNYINIITTLAVIVNAIYVLYTIKTFREIRKQTDLQLKAHLSFDVKILKDNEFGKPEINKSYLNNAPSKDWKASMQTAFPELPDSSLFDGVYFCLAVSNYSNTEVKRILLDVEVIIENSSEVVNSKKLTPKEIKKFKSDINEIFRKGQIVVLPLFSIAAFPIYTINLFGKYYDVRNQEYIFSKISYKNENTYLH